MAPIIPFTADEVWPFLPSKEKKTSVHEELFLLAREDFKDEHLIERWGLLMNIRKEITKALELARQAKTIGHSLDADITMVMPAELFKELEGYKDELRTMCIVSSIEFMKEGTMQGKYESSEYPGLTVAVAPSSFPKCERCWMHDSTIGHDAEHPALCKRCAQVVKRLDDGA